MIVSPLASKKIEKEELLFLKTGTTQQPVLEKKGDNVRIDWGYFYLAGHRDENSTLSFGDYWTIKKGFQTTGQISETPAGDLSGNMAKR